MLVMLGAGNEIERIRARSRHLPNVRVIGFVEQVAPYFDAADVFMFTSASEGEGLPTTLVEASAHDLPVVSDVASGAGDVVRAVGGRLVRDSLAMEKWRTAFVDAADTRGDAERADWRRRHSMDGWMAAHVKVLNSVMDAETPGRGQ
jgi:glycosyltransferase involved in cell wall biosynthesis